MIWNLVIKLFWTRNLKPFLGFPHTMFIVKRMKNNMQLIFIENIFINHEIGINVQTKYLSFKGILYKSESYLCDISCVQLWKTLAQFRCDNTQFEVVLDAWKGICREALSRLRLGEDREWKALVLCLSKYTES